MSQATKARPAQSRRPFLHHDADLLELFFAHSLDGFFFMMRKEPVRRDDSMNLLMGNETAERVFRCQSAERKGQRLEGSLWPGNVRELTNLIERVVILCQGRMLQEEHLGLSGLARRGEKFATLE